jgi:hypothetical protein
MLGYVRFDLFPITLVIANPLAGGANGQHTGEGADLIGGGKKPLV